MLPRSPAVLIVSGPPPDAIERTLTEVAKHLPDAPVRLWVHRRDASGALRELADRHPEVGWTFSGSDVGRIAATNRLVELVPDHDVLLLDTDLEVDGPLTATRLLLSEPGVAAASSTVSDPTPGVRRWDVARRAPTVTRGLVDLAGVAHALRGLPRLSDRLPALPVQVDGYLARRALFLTRAALDALGPFDERLVDAGEDAPWQEAARRAGWRLALVDEPDLRVRDTDAGPVRDPDRREDLDRASRALVLGVARNRGPGTAFTAGAAVLDRVLPARRAVRRRRRRDDAGRAGGRASVVVTSNGLANGGAERQRVLLANALADRGHPVTVVCLQKLGRYTTELDPRVRLVLQPWWQPVVDVAGGDAVVVGGVTNTEMAFARGWRALGRAAGQRRRWLPATHDPAVLDRATYSAAQARALRSADGLLVLSPQHHADLVRHQPLTATVMVAPNGVPPVDPLPARPGVDGPVRFGMLTRVVAYKNPLLLAHALDALGARRADEWTLDIFGDGPDRARLEAATPAHLRDRVRWRGPSPGPDPAFAAIDVLCVPSGFEAFPLVMVEAMVRGLPVMASVSGSVPDMLEGGAAGVLVDPVTPEAWTAALAAALDDRASLRRLGAAGRARALRHYTDAAMADDYQRAIARVTGRDVPGGPAGVAVTL